MNLDTLQTLGKALFVGLFMLLEFYLLILDITDKPEYERRWNGRRLPLVKGVKQLVIKRIFWIILYGWAVSLMIRFHHNPRLTDAILWFVLLSAPGRISNFELLQYAIRVKTRSGSHA